MDQETSVNDHRISSVSTPDSLINDSTVSSLNVSDQAVASAKSEQRLVPENLNVTAICTEEGVNITMNSSLVLK